MKSMIIRMFLVLCIAMPSIETHASEHRFHHPQQALKHQDRPGAQIYQTLCATCHAVKPLIPLGAPRIAVLSDWKPRMVRDIEQMFARIDEGFNAMPARGGCFECSDSELKAAIAYMLPKKTSE